MSWNPALPLGRPDDTGIDTIEALIIPRSRGPGGSEACRALLAPTWQRIGPSSSSTRPDRPSFCAARRWMSIHISDRAP